MSFTPYDQDITSSSPVYPQTRTQGLSNEQATLSPPSAPGSPRRPRRQRNLSRSLKLEREKHGSPHNEANRSGSLKLLRESQDYRSRSSKVTRPNSFRKRRSPPASLKIGDRSTSWDKGRLSLNNSTLSPPPLESPGLRIRSRAESDYGDDEEKAWSYSSHNDGLISSLAHARISQYGLRDDWNSLFQFTLDLPEDTSEQIIHKYQCLTQLSADFVAMASMLGKLIITEFFLPFEARLIKPIRLGGVAGLFKQPFCLYIYIHNR